MAGLWDEAGKPLSTYGDGVAAGASEVLPPPLPSRVYSQALGRWIEMPVRAEADCFRALERLHNKAENLSFIMSGRRCGKSLATAEFLKEARAMLEIIEQCAKELEDE